MNIPARFWTIMLRSFFFALLVLLTSDWLVQYIPQQALYGEIVGGIGVLWHCANSLRKLR